MIPPSFRLQVRAESRARALGPMLALPLLCVLFGCQSAPSRSAAAVFVPVSDAAAQGAWDSSDAASVPAGANAVVPTRARAQTEQDALAVRALASSDFIERSRASEQLVASGVQALPALGAAGEQPVRVHSGAVVSSTRPVVQAILQSSKPDDVQRALRAPWSNVRWGAAEELGRRGSWKPIPELITRLRDKAPEVRGASAEALRRLTNNFFGFEANASSTRRRAATSRWQTWWTQTGRLKADEPPGGTRLLGNRR